MTPWMFGKKKKEGPQLATPDLPSPPASGQTPNLPTTPGPSKPAGDLPVLPLPAAKPDLPPVSDDEKPVEGSELERIQIEKKLQRIADDRAERQKGGADELPALPIPQKTGGSKPTLPALPKPAGEKPELPSLSAPSVGGPPKPALPPLPKPDSGSPPNHPPLPKPGGLPPLPGPASVEDEADQQTRDQERDG